MAQNLVIVESPTKAKTIKKFLPKNFKVVASIGHVRDLPQSAADIPEKLKKEEWAKIGVNVDNDFDPLYVIPKGKTKIINEIKRDMKEADTLYLATDEDREGESISWHLLQVLKPKIPVKRMVFHEITKGAIEHALKDCRDIDSRLVQAQETRRILDRLVGYTVSPLLWKKIAYGLSAGRVQSAGLRLIVERERERISFCKALYWDLLASVAKGGDAFEARLIAVEGKKIATGKDFDESTGRLIPGKEVFILGEPQAHTLVQKLKTTPWTVTSVEEKKFSSKPAPPFITSTLQQEANRKLGLSAKDAMRVAQRLYEEGFITYMRTDSPNLSEEALKGAMSAVTELYGKEYLAPEIRQYKAKSRQAQEAHEAIRPAGAEFVLPKDSGLTGKEMALYDLIWKRTVATQMAEAQKLSVQTRLESGGTQFAASGTRILFAGFLRAYVEGSDDPEAALEDREVILPDLKTGDVLQLKNLEALSHETKPPARYTEASLVQALEKEGIGRPSTYASIIGTVIDRGYVRKIGSALAPTFTGFAVIQLLEKHFENLVDYGFTSQMENALDEIADGERAWLPYLKEFYLGKKGLREQVKSKDKDIKPEASRSIDLKHLQGINIKVGRFGPYVIKDSEKKSGGGELHASIPEDIAPADLTKEKLEEILTASALGPQSLGTDPKTGLPVYCLTGRFGPYVQLGDMPEAPPEEKVEKGKKKKKKVKLEKPKRASVPKGVDYRTMDLAAALKLLSLPRELGIHPERQKPVLAANGRFGPYIMCDGDFRSLKKDDNVFEVTLARALELLAEEKKGRGFQKILREMGAHPADQKAVNIYEGKYGPYLKHGAVNASVPKDKKVEELTMEEAVALLSERAEKKRKK